MAGFCSVHRHLSLECKLCRSDLPEKLTLYLVVDTCVYAHSEAIVGVFFTEDEAEEFNKKSGYAYEIQKLEFNTRNGEV